MGEGVGAAARVMVGVGVGLRVMIGAGFSLIKGCDSCGNRSSSSSDDSDWTVEGVAPRRSGAVTMKIGV